MTAYCTRVLIFLAAATMALAYTFTSCNKDNGGGSTHFKCVSCGSNGVCVNDTCHCNIGFEGTTCATESRSKLTGSWDVTDKIGTYRVFIQQSVGILDVVINSFHTSVTDSVTLSAYMSADSVYIPAQYVGGQVIVGVGTISGNKLVGASTITMRYAVRDSATHTLADFGYYSNNDSSSTWTPTQFGTL